MNEQCKMSLEPREMDVKSRTSISILLASDIYTGFT